MHRLVVQSRVGSDGVLRIEISMGKEDADLEVQVTIDPVQTAKSSMTQEEWRRLRHGDSGMRYGPFVRAPRSGRV